MERATRIELAFSAWDVLILCVGSEPQRLSRCFLEIGGSGHTLRNGVGASAVVAPLGVVDGGVAHAVTD